MRRQESPGVTFVPVTEYAVQAEGLVKEFGDVKALNGIDLVVPRGKVVGLLGPNGSGKTTTVRILATLLKATSGSAQVNGFDVQRQADDVRRSIGLTGQYAAVDEFLTGRENLTMFGGLFHLEKKYVAATTGSSGESDRQAGNPVFGRAHHWLGPALADRPVGRHL